MKRIREDIIKEAIKQLKGMKYKPKAIWINLDGTIYYIVTDDIDRSNYAKLLRKLK